MGTAVSENRISNGAIATQPQRINVKDESPVAYLMDSGRFEQSQRIAKMMSVCDFMPDHLIKGKKESTALANCMLVYSQAMRWHMDPFAIAPETYVVQGKLGYQGKLIAGVVNARAGLAAPLQAIYSNGKDDKFAAVIFGSKEAISTESKGLLVKYANDDDTAAASQLILAGVMCIRVSVGQCKTTNKMWTSDPQQKLFYTGATKWARRFCPELMLGIITDQDFDQMGSQPVVAEGKPRTLDELTKLVQSEASIEIPTKEPEPEDETPLEGEVLEPSGTSLFANHQDAARE